MTSHELALQLLKGPDRPVVIAPHAGFYGVDGTIRTELFTNAQQEDVYTPTRLTMNDRVVPVVIIE